tara:strand:+ start:1554 stop:2225 length:672 start_codon:yes stop_codon:yes gene_type:complete
MSKLYLVPTPIGNLEDITLRSLRILKEVDIVLAEDTRVTKKIFTHYQIDTKLSSFHIQNEHKVFLKWINQIKKGVKIALVSDAGTPSISDPGFLLVREAILEGILVNCLPGPTAFVPALVNSGMPTDKFIFEGFLPRKKGRKAILEGLVKQKKTIIFYESPHRILKTLYQFLEYFGEELKISVSREITKKFEETIRGDIKCVISHFENRTPKGEFVIVLDNRR